MPSARTPILPSLFAVCAVAVLAPAAPASARDGDSARLLFQARTALADAQAKLAERLAREAYARPDAPVTNQLAAFELAMAAIEAQGDPPRMLDALRDGAFEGPELPKDGRIALWRARALALQGKPAEAAALLVAEAPTASESLRPRFALQLPSALLAAGDTNAALAAYAAIDALPIDTPGADAAKLEQARLLLAHGRAAEAASVLGTWLAATGPTLSPAAGSARLLLARLLLDGPEPQSSLTVLQPLLEREGVPVDVRAAAQLGVAAAADSRGDVVAALGAREQAVALAESPETKFAALADLTRYLCRAGDAERALTWLREAARLNRRGTDVALLRLDVAEALHRQRLAETALTEVQAVIEAHAEATLEARAQRLRGEILATLGRPEEAAVALLRASELSPDPIFQAACLFRAGEAQSDADAHAQAAETLLRFLERFPDSPLAPRAALLRGESLASTAPADAERQLLATAEQYPNSPEGAHAVFRAAQLAAARDDAPTAMARYQQAAEHPAGPADLRAASFLGQGLLQFRAFHFDLALGDFERASAEGEGPVADQAAYLRAAALYNLGLEKESLEAATEYLERRPDSAWTPDVTYWLGRYHFNRQEFGKAEAHFLRFAEAWPTRPECDGALLWAARAQFALRRYPEASATALRLVRENPRSALVPEARLIHGESLCELMRFDEAILVFDELLTLHPDSPWTAQALGRKGDALFTLGTDDQSRYKESVAAYETLLAMPDLPLDSQLQAAYKIGRCHEKAGQSEKALERYYRDVVLRFLEARAEGTWPNERARAWFSRAALSAVDLHEQQEQWSAAVAILRRMAREDVPGRAEAADRAQRLQRDHPEANATALPSPLPTSLP